MSSSPSLLIRLLTTVIIGLVAVSGVHMALSVWLERSVYSAERSRLMSWSNAYIQAWSEAGVLADSSQIEQANISPPDARFRHEGSGVWAVLVYDGQVVWASPSTPEEWRRAPLQSFEFSEKNHGLFSHPGRGTFSFAANPDLPHRLALPVSPPLPEDVDAPPVQTRYLLIMGETAQESYDRLTDLRDTVRWGLFLSLIAILISQAVAARWTAAPLRKLSEDLKRVRSGQQKRLSTGYPKEIEGVVQEFNDLLDREEGHMVSHRNAMDNLAHSLKTPLAVIRSAAESRSPEDLRSEVFTQVERMDRQVAYHLSVASRQGRAWRPGMKPVVLLPLVTELASGLEKIYANKGALCEFVDLEQVTVAMEEGDVQEMLGNLLDNAFKWCRSHVMISAKVYPDWVVIEVGDDGPGVPQDRQSDIRARGRRADERTAGHGIGLAAVDDIVSVYAGQLEVGKHEELGGALFTVRIPRPDRQ